MKVPNANPLAGYLARQPEIDAAVQRVLSGGSYILGLEVRAFEKEFAAYCEAGHCVGVGSGTDAIVVALRALGLGPGDEVITVAHTAVATVAAITLAGCTPVLVDIVPDTCTIAAEGISKACTARTRAIVVVHLYGHPAEMDAVLSVAAAHDLFVIEDCAQAHGSRYKGRRVGSIGDVGCFSFYPTKNLGALGDGGALITSDVAVADRARMLREYGWDAERNSQVQGMNTRLDEIQAAILRVKLPYLDADNAARRRVAARYAGELDAVDGLSLPAQAPDSEHVYHLYVIRAAKRDERLMALRGTGIGAAVHYPRAVHQMRAYARLASALPETERAVNEILSLPMFPEMTEAQQQTVVDAVRRVCA